MKRIAGLILTAVFLSALCIPCTARDSFLIKQRGYPGFSDIPSTESLYYNAVKTCYEFGWMDGVSEDTFGVQEPLTKAEMVTLLARLYSVRSGGDGTIPELPENLGDCVRFYDTDGNLVCNAFSGHMIDLISYNAGPQGLFAHFYDVNLSQESLTIEIGFPGDGIACSAPGVRMGYDEKNEFTKYLFTFPEGTDISGIEPEEFQEYCRFLENVLEVNQREGIDDPTPYDAVLYLLYREPANLPYCFRTMSLEGGPSEPVWRMELAVPLAALCQELPEVREADTIPDLPDWRFHDAETAAVLSLYRRGILEGFDEAGTFAGADWLTRGQAALMAARALALMQT